MLAVKNPPPREEAGVNFLNNEKQYGEQSQPSVALNLSQICEWGLPDYQPLPSRTDLDWKNCPDNPQNYEKKMFKKYCFKACTSVSVCWVGKKKPNWKSSYYRYIILKLFKLGQVTFLIETEWPYVEYQDTNFCLFIVVVRIKRGNMFKTLITVFGTF